MVDGFTSRTISKQKTLGEMLKDARTKAEISLENAEIETKIRLKYLKALENNNFKAFTAEVYLLGCLSRYAKFLRLDEKKIIDKYKNQQESLSGIVNVGVNQNTSKPFLVDDNKQNSFWGRMAITPQSFVGLVVFICVFSILGYIWFQVKSFAAAPALELKNPSSEIVVSMDNITIEGKTDSNASLKINNELVAVDSNGYFVQIIKLSEGLNIVEITAHNKADKETKKTIQILAKY